MLQIYDRGFVFARKGPSRSLLARYKIFTPLFICGASPNKLLA
ncbi:hypothetical protein HMPREF7215_2099 [Pyramidobacter piscolens W5455]|uniref:Uncharacterized protein n=1 Tax=Pyramidobacter piscolens W5455 TaxID=352165 RepID=A0ABM9ZU57_9BACT|nr:hypothetical protein HMPREF7215_2099 [Pyramidobacter piscolens W5455]